MLFEGRTLAPHVICLANHAGVETTAHGREGFFPCAEAVPHGDDSRAATAGSGPSWFEVFFRVGYVEKMIQRFWTIEDNPPTYPGCLVIPSYALKSASLPTRPTRAEIELAFQWWKKFPNAKLIMSTGDNQGLGIPNSRVMADYAVSLGLPRENVIEEDRSWNTHTNLLYSMEMIKAQNLGTPTLVTLDLYTRRAVATARKMGWKDFHWLSVFSKGEPAYGYKWLQTYSRATLFCYEVGAMIFSKIVGWV